MPLFGQTLIKITCLKEFQCHERKKSNLLNDPSVSSSFSLPVSKPNLFTQTHPDISRETREKLALEIEIPSIRTHVCMRVNHARKGPFFPPVSLAGGPRQSTQRARSTFVKPASLARFAVRSLQAQTENDSDDERLVVVFKRREEKLQEQSQWIARTPW